MDDIDRGRLWESFVDGLPDFSMVLLDVEGSILSWNAGAAKMLGYVAHEVIGRNFSCLYTAEDAGAGKPAMSLKRAAARGRDDEQGHRVRRDGIQLEARGVLIPLYDGQKELIGFGSLTREAASVPQAAGSIAGSASPNVISLTVVKKTGPKKILVVDDNAELLEALETQLTSLGYEVIVAPNGAAALEVLARVADIDLLFTDVVMPGGMNGSQLAEQARTVRPGLRVLFTSGYFEPALVRDRAIAAGVRVLAKPYRKQELASRVSEALSDAL